MVETGNAVLEEALRAIQLEKEHEWCLVLLQPLLVFRGGPTLQPDKLKTY